MTQKRQTVSNAGAKPLAEILTLIFDLNRYGSVLGVFWGIESRYDVGFHRNHASYIDLVASFW